MQQDILHGKLHNFSYNVMSQFPKYKYIYIWNKFLYIKPNKKNLLLPAGCGGVCVCVWYDDTLCQNWMFRGGYFLSDCDESVPIFPACSKKHE